MSLRAADIVPISEARAGLTELSGRRCASEKVVTKNGASYVALVDARRPDYYRALGLEDATLVLADDGTAGLRETLAGQ
ncbi:type II toxin-antitoxin system Phd/YefM family antitoxin [Variovorax paradoxus]|nr:type II toxin-antitoxin system Phd/YefM family antitoxin [Variovorax paradoxus]